jgi:hypothetical protein
MRRHSPNGVSGTAVGGGGVLGDARDSSDAGRRHEEDVEIDKAAASTAAPSLEVAFTALFLVIVLVGGFSLLAYKSMNMHFLVPLDSNASLTTFSEGRAKQHVLALASFGRQVQISS